MTHVLVLCGGEMGGPAPQIDAADHVVAADSGLGWAARLGIDVDLVVGDFDSVDGHTLKAAVNAGAAVERHPTAKDSTDFDLALVHALSLGAHRITVLGGGGGRLDHLIGNVTRLAADDLSEVEVTALMPPATVTVVRDRTRTLFGRAGDYVSLFAFGALAEGIFGEGFRYPLDALRLAPGASLGISNELTGEVATVRCDSGVVLAIQPGQNVR